MSRPDPPSDIDPDAPADPEQNGDALPVPGDDTRPYIQVRPADDPLTARTVEMHVRRLHQLDGAGDDRRWYRRLLGTTSPPLIECRLVSGGDDAAIAYQFGIDPPEATDALERVLRGLFPDSYEFERAAVSPAEIGTSDGVDPDDDRRIAAVEFRGRAERRRDWQTRLAPFGAFLGGGDARVPLAGVVEAMAEHPDPIVYQALLRPKPDWSRALEARRTGLEASQDTIGDQLLNVLAGPPDADAEALPAADDARLAELDEKDARQSFAVNARAVVLGTGDADPEYRARDLATAFADVSHTCYRIEGTVTTDAAAARVLDAVRDRTFRPPDYDRPGTRLPWTANTSPGIVADPGEVSSFCLLGGDALTAAGGRALATRRGERTALPRPPSERLSAYRGPGLTLGYPLTQDGTADDEPIALGRSLQPLHVGWFGKTGSGKTTALTNAVLDNHAATAGPEILIDPKGDGMATDYRRAHYARFGSLDDVLYFDCAEVLPAFSFFDIRDELDAGVSRPTAVADKVDHYVEILSGIMGRDRFEQAVRSPDVIRYLTKAAFDPVHGADAFAHRDLHAGARRMQDEQSAPPVSDPDLEQALEGVVANRASTFDEIMAGVLNRLEKIPVDRRLARIFNHVPGEDDPHFDLADYLGEDVVIILDTGGLRADAQRALSLVVLSNLWTALRRRARREPEPARPLANLYVEEAASIAASDLLATLLAQSRGFGCSITLSMQFPAQLRAADEAAYDEVLNNISTFVTGNVPVDRRLARRLATADMDADAVGNRLRALRRGQWLVNLPAAFDDPEPRPFLARSLAPPPGDPDGPRPLSADERRTFETAIERARERTLAGAGLTIDEPSPGSDGDEDEDPDAHARRDRVDTALPYTERMPPTVQYDAPTHALRCRECGNRYDPDIEGMRRAIACCSSLDRVDRDDVPVCDLNLKLTPDERMGSGYSDAQLMFLQAVYNAQQLRYDPLEYDLLADSMLRLREYVGIGDDAIQDLIDAGLVRHDTDHPHRMYTVTPDGRDTIGESYRRGVDYGHATGDLEESSEHVFAVEVGRRYLEGEYVRNSDSPVVEAVPYYEIDEGRRLDIAGLDADGEVVVAVEAERVNHDVREAAPADFDKMAECGVEEAIWIVMTQSAGHTVLAALNEPSDGEPRVEKTYAETTPPQQFRIDTPGMTAMYPAEYVRDSLLEDE